ncbi:zinc finger protein 280C-like isoform X3 [Sinocyclocheilus anshuiensis]|uniref:zinc finger protein 280C-like isoform X3 n=1 Tax=Sinocyclocheilus anshuiensis TaxID=1608454 RepID=UPI0007B9D67A|nr:PREDICTED: zinc finger protein 280C-like isoform X3 [Sinocyclocheilus anshuiensis]
MSELFMECEEEELEPWQKTIPEINLIDLEDDDDDEPIFVGEICSSKPAANTRQGAVNQQNQRNVPVQKPSMLASSQKPPQAPPSPASVAIGPTIMVRGAAPSGGNPILIPINTTLGPQTAPQPIIINNQGYIVASPQNLNSSTSFISALGSQYPLGTTLTVVPAAGQQILPQVTITPKPGVIHRPQVQHIQNNVVTLSNVRAPANLSSQSHTTSGSQNTTGIIPATLAKQKTLSLQTMNSKDNGTMINDTSNSGSKGAGNNDFPFKKKCPRCQNVFGFQPLKNHMKLCCPELLDSVFPSTSKPDKQASAPKVYESDKGKLIMLVSDFYYGKCEGDPSLIPKFKSNTTFKCNSCLKMLKNNIRFMNHMKHHLELEKQNSESWESHTTCQHCYRQYSTPFQLQCHIESAHSPFESTTNCKICELAFETEQVLLEHMRDNHKPGEMPYACQVCNYRSSFFSDVDNHFRTVHENTKDLLCPFCLKVLRSGHMYMQHYMRHQKKGIQRCGKCRLNFLTYKEKVEHKTHFHRTYRKPRKLEGLPPGTKVTIRASVSGAQMGSETSSKAYIIPTSPETTKQPVRIAANTTKPNVNGGKAKTTNQFSWNRSNQNNELKSLKLPSGGNRCVECLSEVMDPYVHYPLLLRCNICKFRSSCQKAFRQHMFRFHSNSPKVRFGKVRKPPRGLRSLTLVCLKCDFLADASGTDQMTEHLLNRPNHSCQVIMEPVTNGGSEMNRSMEAHANSKQLLLIKPDTEARDETEPIQISYTVQAIPNKENITEDWSEVLGADKCEPDEVKDDTVEAAISDVSVEESPKSLPSHSPVSPLSALTDEGGVTPSDFLCKTDGIESMNTDSQLEPLTPSKVLEDDATENSQVEMEG